jgi:aldehyde dehydrogenase (NAD+)
MTGKLLEYQWDYVFFTGSPSVGKIVYTGAAKFMTPVTLELGGKNPVVVAADADIHLAAKRCVWGRMMNAGQQCISPDYVLVERSVLHQFNESLVHWVKTLYGSDPMTNGNLGKIVGERQIDRIIDILDKHGGKVIIGGSYKKDAKYVEPTVLQIEDMSSIAMEEETFGPILIVVPVDSVLQAINYINSKPKSLSLYIFSSSRYTQEQIIYNTSAGGVTVNGTLFHVAHPDMPFGGVGASGLGSYHGKKTFETFTHMKPVLRKAAWRWDGGLLSDPWFVYPPWDEQKIKIIRFLTKFT